MKIHLNKLPWPNQLKKNQFVGLDVEMWGMNADQLHRANSGRLACVSLSITDDEAYIITEEEAVRLLLGRIDECVWCIHNASFDITQMRRYADIPPRNKVWDSLIIERLMFNGYYTNFSLKDLVRRYCNRIVEKDLQKSFSEDGGEMTDEQIEYAAEDALYHRHVALEQKKIISSVEFDLYKQVELPNTWVILDQIGIRIDKEGWIKNAEKNQQRYDEIEKELSYNPKSYVQIPEYFKENFKINLPNGTGQTALEKVKKKTKNKKAIKHIDLILEARKYSKRASTYGMNFIEKYLEDDIIVANFNTNKAKTGRESSNDPNMQNIPIRDTKEFRKLMIARLGRKLLVADYGAQEPRIAAYITRDPLLLEIFNSGNDPYIEMGKIFYEETIEKSDPRRSRMKDVFLGACYGLSKYGLFARYDIPLDEGEMFLQKANEKFPVLTSKMAEYAKETIYVKTLFGNKVWLNPYDYHFRNLARNSPIQGTAAPMTKLSKIALWKWQMKTFNECFLVFAVHDELVQDVPIEHVEEVKNKTEEIMTSIGESICPGIPFIADVKVVDNWAEAK